MHYAIFTLSGEGLPVAQKLQDEGNDVTVAMITDIADIKTSKEKVTPEKPEEKARRLKTFKGILDRKPAREVLKMLKSQKDTKNTFLYFDMNLCFKFATALSGLGFMGNFPTENDRMFEVDRKMAKEFCQKNYPDINIPETQEFKTIKEGIAFLEDTEDLWVLKGEDDDAKTVVPSTEDPELAKEQLFEALEKGKKDYEKAGFVLERKITSPIEVTPEKVYYDGKPLFIALDLENKRIAAGDVGPMTGCAQDMCTIIPLDCKLAKMAFPPVVDQMAKDHKGWFIWDLSILFDSKSGKPYMGEFCPNRCGYNSFYTELSMLDIKGDYFEAIVAGLNPFDYAIGKFASSIRLFNRIPDPDFPKMMMKDIAFSVDPEVEPDVWLMDAYQENKKLFTCGYEKDLAVATGYGNTIEEAAKMAYKTVAGFSFTDLEYRCLEDYLSKTGNGAILNRYQYLKDKRLL